MTAITTSSQPAAEQSPPFHALSAEEAIKNLKSSPTGLSVDEVERRLKEYGPNEISEAKRISPLSILINQFKNFLMYLLLAAVAISFAMGIIEAEIDPIIDAVVILVIVIFAVVLGFFQEFRAEKSIEALKRMAAPKSKVVRAGEVLKIASRELVPGDIILLTAGDKVPADSRLLEDIALSINEAPLTGESVPVTKKTALIFDEKTPVADRKNMVFTATAVTYGKGKAIVAKTGGKTEFGKIAEMLQSVAAPPTPLETRMNHVGKWLGILCVAVCAVVGVVGIMQGRPIFAMFLLAVALAIAAVPEALPAVVTMSLAVGVKRMAKRNSIVRRLPAVETLGCTNVICSDKTGTLTRGEMNVRKLLVDGRIFTVSGEGYIPKGEFFLVEPPEQQTAIDPRKNPQLMLLLKIATLCNDAFLKNKSAGGSDKSKEPVSWHIDGDPTEGALIVAAAKAGIEQSSITKEYPRVGECPFSSERRRMSTIHPKPEGGKVACVKGAPEVILELSTQLYEDGKIKELSKEKREQILKIYQDMAGEALRVLGMAYKDLPENSDINAESVEKNLIFVGLMGMIDAPREEAIKSIRLCKEAGIRTVMVTGDHKLTAQAIAKELGIKSGKVLSGVEMDAISEEQLEAEIDDVDVYARVAPEHKTRLVKALKKKGYVVAMTGDGVNDAPALKNADIGIAMGISGTEVTKEASDMILTDDNFASIVAAVEEGRGIYDNIKKYLIYLLSANIGEIFVLFIAIMLGWPAPLIAIQLLWVNLVTDGLPAIALGIDPADPDIMKRPPRDPKEGIFKGVKITLIGIAVVMAAGILLVFNMVAHDEGIIRGQTFAFASIVLFELIFVFSCRSQKHSLFQIGPLRNKWLIYSVLTSLALLFVVIYVPALAPLFDVEPLGTYDWIAVIIVGVSGFICYEVAKLVMLKVHGRRSQKSFTSTSAKPDVEFNKVHISSMET